MRASTGRRHAACMLFTAIVLTAVSTATLAAHDFWLVPNAFAFARGARVEVLGQSGTKFPTSSGATQPAQLAEARVVGRSIDEKITDLVVSERSLRLRHKPSADGQYVVAVALAPRDARTTPARLQRYLELEGAPELSARYEREGRFPKADSIVQSSAKFAKTLVEVGSNGPRAFDRPVGHALELIPLDDPARLRPGASVRMRLLFHGKPVPHVALRAGWGAPSAVSQDPAALPAPSNADQVVETGSDGIAVINVSEAGWWNVRTLYAAAMPGMSEHWEVGFATLVFGVSGQPAGDDGDLSAQFEDTESLRSDSADAVGAVRRFHAALAGGDSSGALAQLSPSVQIIESGGVEDLVHYRAHHLPGDMSFARATKSDRTILSVAVRGDVAWIVSTSVTTGESNGRAINAQGAVNT